MGGIGVLISILVLIFIVLLNIPFGYWRANVKKFSVQWFLAIHLPVPYVAYLRQHTEFTWTGITILCFLAAYFIGQYLGSGLSKELRRYGKVGSSLFHDLIRRSWIILIRR